MKKELSQIITISLPPLGDANNIVKKIHALSEVIFDEEVKESSNGVLYQQKMTIVCGKDDNAFIASLGIRFYAIIVLSDGEEYYTWGNSNLPVKCIKRTTLEKYILELSREALEPLL